MQNLRELEATRETRRSEDMEMRPEGHGKTWLGAITGGEGTQATCLGCLDRPDRACAACGARASMWTEAGDGRHTVAWCAACHELLLSGRPANAQPLVYLNFGAARATA